MLVGVLFVGGEGGGGGGLIEGPTSCSSFAPSSPQAHAAADVDVDARST